MKSTFIFIKAAEGGLAKQAQAILNIVEAKEEIRT